MLRKKAQPLNHLARLANIKIKQVRPHVTMQVQDIMSTQGQQVRRTNVELAHTNQVPHNRPVSMHPRGITSIRMHLQVKQHVHPAHTIRLQHQTTVLPAYLPTLAIT
jgi:hypothetical protein